MRRWTKDLPRATSMGSDTEFDGPAEGGHSNPIPATTKGRTPRSEAGRRRATLRRRHQRRRRAACALCRRTSRSARSGRSVDDVRARLRHLARRVSRRHRAGERRSGAGGFASITSAMSKVFARWSERVFGEQHSYLDELKWLDAEGPKSSSLLTHLSLRTGRLRLRHLLQLSLLPRLSRRARRCRRARSSCRRPSATTRSASASSPRIFRGVRALMYNSPEEKRLIQAVVAQPRRTRRGRWDRV